MYKLPLYQVASKSVVSFKRKAVTSTHSFTKFRILNIDIICWCIAFDASKDLSAL